MSRLSKLAEVLVECRVVTPERWDVAAAAGGRDLNRVLDTLTAGPPYWWDGEHPEPPGLTEYQREAIEARYAARELDLLCHDLALNQFLLLDKLGQGGQGEVYRGRQLSPPRYAAIKTLIRDTEVSRRRFEREARTLLTIQHPAVARFYMYERVRDAAGHPTDEYLIAMELVEGIDLGRLVRRVGPVPWRFAVRWAVDLLGGLAVLHKRGFLHQDVKPENVMIQGPDPGPDTSPGETAAKLLDFGAVRLLDGGDVAGAGRVFVGTPEYAPPEQWGGTVVPASDLYTLGGTLFYAFTGRCPYQLDRRDAYAYRRAHVHQDVPSPRESNADVPPGVNDLVRRMMAKNPEERGTAEELAEELGRLAGRGGRAATAGKLPNLPGAKPPPPVAAMPRPLAGVPRPAPAAKADPPRGLLDRVLGTFERMFIPGHVPYPPGASPQVPERLAALLRRPAVFLILVGALVLLALWLFRA